MTDALKDLWHTLATVAPKALLFVAILAVGFFVARLVSSAVTKVLLRAGFNRLVDKAGLNRVLGRTYPNVLAGKLAFYAVILVVLQAAFGVFGPNPVSALITSVIAFLPRLAVALALVVVAGVIANHARTFITDTLNGVSWANVASRATQAFILGLGVIAALGQVGIALTVTLPVLVSVLGTLAGVLIVGVGGGLIEPMRARWESYLSKAETELAPAVDPVEPVIEPEPEVDPVDEPVDAPTTRTATITITQQPTE